MTTSVWLATLATLATLSPSPLVPLSRKWRFTLPEIRPVPDADLEEFLRLEVEIYTLPITFGDGAALRRHLAPDAALAAYADDGRLAGRLITYPLRMWLDGATLAVGGEIGRAHV